LGPWWGANDTIVFANARGGLLQVPAAGGTPQPFTKLDQSKGERSHRLPHFLPDGRSILFTITQSSATTGLSNAQIVVRSLADGQQRVVVTGGVDGRYVESGHIVYARENTLMAVPFDPRRLAVTGPAIAVVEGVLQAHGPFGPGGVSVGETGAAQFSVSPSGALVYTPGGPFSENLRSLVWVDRHGAEEPLAAPLHNYLGPRLSPDGKRLLVGALGFEPTMWLYDMTRGTFAPTGPPTDVFWPIWSPDGRRVTYGSDLAGRGLESVRLDGGPAETIIAGGNNAPGAWSPDGRTLAFTRLLPTSGWEMRVWSADGGDRALHAPSSTPFLERYPTFSPDGRWLAYASDESGRDEVYVQPYPGSGREQISTGGGLAPAWSRDGRELFYMIPSPGNPFVDPVNTRLMVVSVSHDSVLVAGPPRFLFEGHYTQCSPMRCYDPAPDGQHFVMVKFSDSPLPNEPVNTQMVVVLNWFDELKRMAH
jgi:serine/threonine-protein kinase